MGWRWLIRGAAVMFALSTPASAEQAQWQLGGTFKCVGRPIGSEDVKVTCEQELRRGNQIITTVANFTMSGPAARHYVGKHDKCWHIDPENTRINQDVVTCPGVPEWW
jgi:hypothetical protein